MTAGQPIPLMVPHVPRYKKVAKYLQEMDTSKVYANNGPLVRRLEARIAEKLNVLPTQVVATTSATTAIHGAATISKEEVFNIPSFTFTATVTGVANSGKAYRFVDSEKSTMDIRVEDLNILGGGIVDVRPFGAPVRFVAGWNQREVIVDAAASLGRKDLDLQSLPSSWVVVFSLHATKPIAAGEGGIAVFGDESKARDFRKWINFGFSNTRVSQSLGTNGKMSEVTAAYAHASLDDFFTNEKSSMRRQLAQRKLEGLHRLRGLGDLVPGIAPYWIIRFDSEKTASSFSQHLQAAGIESRFWWGTPCHRMKAFSSAIATRAELPTADFLAGTVLGLPNYVGMSRKVFISIHRAMKDFHS
jgi:dTDP-4-amino-4,6-dideoxygalactose transaminase